MENLNQMVVVKIIFYFTPGKIVFDVKCKV